MAHRHFPIVLTTLAFSLAWPGLRAAPTAATATPDTEAVAAPTTSSPSTDTAPAASPATSATPAVHAATYTVVAGDSYSKIAKKCGCTVKQLKKANAATTADTLKPGQVIKLPPGKSAPAKKTKAAKSTAPKTSTPPTNSPPATPTPPKPVTTAASSLHHHSVIAQPVQDFDVPSSTFASCPVPPPVEKAETVASAETTSVPPAEPVKLANDGSFQAPAADRAPADPAELATSESAPAPVSHPAPVVPSAAAPEHKPFFSGLTKLFHSDPILTTPSTEWSSRFLEQSRNLGNMGICYDDSWRPPGESRPWAMDCSNTSRYLYKVTTGIQLPRTASDQYYYLHLQDKAWDVPVAANGMADCNYLRENLKPGDLLFWENTYRPERQPPITHVMVFLGSNEKGQWIMAGSQSGRGGEHNRTHGGPDIYVFDPTKPCGGYSTWLGIVHHQGRFCAYGRPLEADPSKLAVAANN